MGRGLRSWLWKALKRVQRNLLSQMVWPEDGPHTLDIKTGESVPRRSRGRAVMEVRRRHW